MDRNRVSKIGNTLLAIYQALAIGQSARYEVELSVCFGEPNTISSSTFVVQQLLQALVLVYSVH